MSRFLSRAASLLFLLFAFTAAADDNPMPAAPAALSLDECIARALVKNFDLKIQGFTTANARESVQTAKATYDPSFTVDLARSLNQSAASGSKLDGTTVAGPRTDVTNGSVGASQKIVTGATLALNSGLNKNYTNSSFSILNPAYNGDVGLSITQPLLKNAGLTVNRAAILNAEYELSRANLSYRSRLLQVIHDTEFAYYNLVFAREQLQVKQLSLEAAQKLYDENQTRQQTGVATSLDVLTAQVGVANARNGVVQAEKTVHDAEDALLQVIGLTDFTTSLGPVHFEEFTEPVPTFDRSYQLARNNDPEFLSSQKLIEEFKLDVLTSKRNRLPELDLTGAGGYTSKQTSYDRALNRLPHGDGYNWQVDLSLTFPWGNRAGNAAYHTALNNLRSQQTALEQLDQDLVVEVRTDVRTVTTNLDSVKISTLSAELSEKQYELQKAKFDAGLSTSREVLQSQADLENARLSELQAKVSLRQAVSNLHQVEGSSLERYKIASPE